MNILDALMNGDMDAVNREMEERQFRNMASFAGHFRDAMAKNMRPSIAWWVENGGTHEPSCGLFTKGDLLRWVNAELHGKKVRLPSLRYDMVGLAVEGKIDIKGVELLAWIATKLDSNTRNVFIALERSRRKK